MSLCPRKASKFTPHIGLGNLGEKAALQYLRKRGMRLLKRNWRCRMGEIDLIMQDGDVLVFVEVKTRRDSLAARKSLAASINIDKRRRLRRLAEWYIRKHYRRPQEVRCRIDFVGIILDDRDIVVSAKHYRAAI